MERPALREETGVLMERYETEPEHVLHVEALALRLYDGLADWHGLAPVDRLLLGTAARLHDIGWAVTQPDGNGHHKESARLIRDFAWTSLDPAEVELVALVARYHRKSIPMPEHEAYSALAPADRRRVRVLAACLRIGDALDRRHLQRVHGVGISWDERSMVFQVASGDGAAAELAAAEKKADLLRLEFGGEVRFLGSR
jgi:exopolyphosphatase/guanosine-5'-triphosphate,3'-diphosphate pyrophosphatase